MITILSGSPRKNSNTLRVARAIASVAGELAGDEEIRIIDFNGFDIPSVSQGVVRPDALTPWQKSLYDSCRQSDLIIILTPEYNWFPSAEIIQMIHTMGSFKFLDMWNNKVFATCGTSNGRGGRMPAVQLSYTINKILNVLNCDSIVCPKVFESQFTDKVLDTEGRPTGNEEYMNGLRAFTAHAIKFRTKWVSA